MTTGCNRSWEVEAARDGRLTGEARASSESHQAACRSCAHAALALASMARDLRGLGDGDVDEVSLRRLRGRVLEAVDAEQTGRARDLGVRARVSSRIAAAAIAAILLGLLAFFARPGAHPEAAAPAPRENSPAVVAETRVEVTADDGARYTRTTGADVDRFELLEGALRLRVRREAGGRRVLVKVPDGEVEDVGTVFLVEVRDGHLERVGVEEGRVVVRIADAAPVTVEAGSGWKRRAAASAAATAPAAPATSAAPIPRATASAAASESARAGAEDAAYLEVLRLLHEGREREARAAAASYLGEFPAGFRRAEMASVARGRSQDR